MVHQLSTLVGKDLVEYAGRPRTYHVGAKREFRRISAKENDASEYVGYVQANDMIRKSFSFEVYQKTKEERQELKRMQKLSK